MRGSEQGFTLIETLVALAILSLAGLALLRLEGASGANAAMLDDHLVGQIVAHNIAVEAVLEEEPPARGTISGTERNGGRLWRWTRRVSLAPEPRLLSITIDVRDEQGLPAGTLFVVRPGP